MDTNLFAPGALALGLVTVTCGYGCHLWWRSHLRSASACLTADGVQALEVLVRDGYQPANVWVRARQPFRLMLRREENDPCSSEIYLTEPPLTETTNAMPAS